MAQRIFVNLPVKDLKRSMAVFTALGYTFNPQFTDEAAPEAVADYLAGMIRGYGSL